MKRVLAIDDSKDFLELLKMLLEDEGHEVISYSSMIKDVQEIERMHPDLIILDLLLGEDKQGGWQTLQILKGQQDTRSIPVILCTAAEHAV